MPRLQLLIKPSSSACNLTCTYCFYEDVAANRSCGYRGMMTYETLENLVKKALEYSTYICGFAFQGGEPTLVGLEFYKKLIEYQKKYNKNSVEIFNSIQTNGFNLGKDWALFFKENDFLVGVSIDGAPKVHDYYRKDKRGNGTLTGVMSTIRLFDRLSVKYNILSVVTGKNAIQIKKTYEFFKKYDFRYLQFIPCLEPFANEKGESEYHLSKDAYANFLIDVFDLWYEDFINGRGVSVRHIDNWIMAALGGEPESCNMCGKCSIQWVVESDGSVYPCDFYVLDEWKIGNIGADSFEDMLKNEKAKQFISESLPVPKKCKECRFYFLCRNGCKRERAIDGNGDNRYYYCESVIKFFTEREKQMVKACMVVKNNLQSRG